MLRATLKDCPDYRHRMAQTFYYERIMERGVKEASLGKRFGQGGADEPR